MRTFAASDPSQVQCGPIEDVGPLLTDLGVERVFLVTGKSSFRSSGAEARLASTLASRYVQFFDDITPNPRSSDVQRGVEVLRKGNADIILAIGGGSVLDTAKMINICAANNHSVESYLLGTSQFSRPGLPLIAVPTTAGTGSEATHFAVAYHHGRKYSLAHDWMLPEYFFLDHRLTCSVPAYHAASSGIDALGQAIESFWSINSTDQSRAYSAQAIRLLSANLPKVNDNADTHTRKQLLSGAHLAGKAINIAKTTAPHALSYAITHRFGVAHGHAVGLTLSAVFSHNIQRVRDAVIDTRGELFVESRMRELEALLKVDSPTQAAKSLSNLMKTVGLASNLRDVGVTADEIGPLADAVNDERLANNPVRLTRADTIRILHQVY